MHGLSLKTIVVSVGIVFALMSSGCGLWVRNITVVEDFEIPTLATLGEDADPGWIEYLAGQDYEVNRQLCDLDVFQEELAARLPGFLAERIWVRSLRVVSLRFVAQEGDFTSIDTLDSVITVDGEHYIFASGVRPGGLGRGITIRPRPRLNLADAINDDRISCINTYFRIEGELPEDPLIFDVVLNYRLRIGFRLF